MACKARKLFGLVGSYKFVDYRFVLESWAECCTKRSCLLLDAGCGKGDSILCPSSKMELVGIDVLRSNVVTCSRRWRDRSFVVGDLIMLPFVEGAFGGTFCADVLEHIEDKGAAMNELSRVTQTDGFLIACSPNVLNPILWLDTKFPALMKALVIKFATPGHYDRHSRLSPSSLMKMLNSSGYQMDYLCLLGYPLFSQRRHIFRGLLLLWVLFDRLTKHKPFFYLKEHLLWKATRV
jgi:SAM-dependent methyltransferase